MTAKLQMYFSTEEEFVEPPDELKIDDDDIEVSVYLSWVQILIHNKSSK